jgi:cyclopropane fatty-acyl-phospholipid synthase-like methyltransferase
MNNADVARYYDTHQFYYSYFWSPSALHYGLWYPNTRNLPEAITNTNILLAKSLNIAAHDFVLDAGCGVGGTSIFIAETAGARVQGITLSTKQLSIANALANKSAAKQLLSFSQMDYCHTDFGPATFSKIVAIESVCHASDKREFLEEALRLLRPGGQLGVVDFFFAKADLSRHERDVHEKSMSGWAVSNLASVAQFDAFLANAGFVGISFVDLKEYIWPSVERIYRYGLLAWPINFVKSTLGLAPKSVACLYQRDLFRQKIGTYGMFVATKPNR